ncbi:uncharacterized protein LOC123562980 isoform X2 [Mercenaria mercenaria]|uniref:uncharacterized protein LOC123562980 isoform X1 n=1 Tax=Mercenaria mercenaria TaxID=6596 RepID=UPI001E1D698E|nr:uncharacterized protein LOC123562980 isoform X1 [Mercenaria mercenaria]XP_045211489.1 uncharacterized protein LOC123562980 isoform X2 [Mercenaria mercenaria]
MKEYRPVDAVYEDIYDFDDVKYDARNGIIRPRELYREERTHNLLDCHNTTGENVCFQNVRDDKVHLPNIPYDKARLPPIAASNALEKIPRVKPVVANGSDAVIKNKVVNLDVERKPYIPKHAKNMPEYANISCSQTKPNHLPNITDGTREHRAHIQELVDHDEMYRSLMAGVPDKSLLEKSPQVIEYERRNNVKRLLSRQKMPQAWERKDHPSGDNAMEARQRFDEMTSHGAKTHHNAHRLPDIHQKSVQENDKPMHQPLPPKAPKPEDDALTRKRRKHLRTKTQIVKDNPRAVHHVPRPQVARMEIDYEKEVNEALRAQREFSLLHKEMAAKSKTKVCDTKVLCPTPVTASNSNLSGCSTPSRTPSAAVNYKSAEPVKGWNGEAAKRKLGFKSREKMEKEETTAIDVGRMPEKIRKQMKKYFS